MTLSAEISQSTKVHGKRVLIDDNNGSASIRKLRHYPIDTVRDFPRFCGRFGVQDEDGSIGGGVPLPPNHVNSENAEDTEVEAEEHHSPITSMKPNSDPSCKPSKVQEFEWVEVDAADAATNDDISSLSHEEWQNYTTHKSRVEISNNLGRGKEVDESEDLSIVPYDVAEDISCRNKVQEILNHYHELCIKLSLENEEESNDGSCKAQVHIKSAMILKKANKWLNREQTVGHVPGVEIGDTFKFRAELVVVGLHREFMSGISYATVGEKIYAFSVVDSGRYENKVKSSNVLIYSGQGGNPKIQTKKHSKDQELQKGNLALKNSLDAKLPVRVIRKVEVEGKKKMYIYDGLYNVMKFSCNRDETGKVGFMFEMVRVEGQPDCDYVNISKHRMSIKPVESKDVISEDLSNGKEKYPVMVVNELNDEKPRPFTYITKMLVLHLQEHSISSGCGCSCIDGCSDTYQCNCVRKNGGEIPFNEHGAIVKARKKIYECGPNCECPPSCQNKSSQHGVKYPLEVFKTKTTGWGVRSRENIPIGGFICEYLGELVGDMEADKRVHDEYLFDLADGSDFTIDAARFGNVSRFINHACEPNLYAQDVFYDHGNEKLPHVMFFASDDIPAMTELTYDYNYKIDSLRDANGNIKKKICCCGSTGCTKRMY